MAIDAVFPTLSSAVQPGSAGLQTDQAKPSDGTGEKTQTQNAVNPTASAEDASDNGLSAGNKENRGQFVDLKV